MQLSRDGCKAASTARPSGTEDIYKIYAESFHSKDHLRRIVEEAQTIVSAALAGREPVTVKFKVGDHVRWNSEAGYVSGRIIKVHKRDTEYKGHPRRASEDEPQYEIKSDKTEHIAMHKGRALRKIG